MPRWLYPTTQPAVDGEAAIAFVRNASVAVASGHDSDREGGFARVPSRRSRKARALDSWERLAAVRSADRLTVGVLLSHTAGFTRCI